MLSLLYWNLAIELTWISFCCFKIMFYRVMNALSSLLLHNIIFGTWVAITNVTFLRHLVWERSLIETYTCNDAHRRHNLRQKFWTRISLSTSVVETLSLIRGANSREIFPRYICRDTEMKQHYRHIHCHWQRILWNCSVGLSFHRYDAVGDDCIVRWSNVFRIQGQGQRGAWGLSPQAANLALPQTPPYD